MNKTAGLLTIATATAFSLAALAGVHYELKTAQPMRKAVKVEQPARSAKSLKGLIRPFENRGYLKTPGPKKAAPVFDSSLPVLYGSLLYSDADWFEVDDTYQVGYYAFQPESSIKIQPICVEANAYVNGGGAYSDHKIHYHLWEMYSDEDSETGITFHNYYCVVNTDDWSFVNVVNYSDNQENIAYDMTYDPVTKNLYAFQWGPYESSYCDFALVDKDSGETSTIAKVPDMVALASDNFGLLFAVGADGNCYYVDKTNGSMINIGATGVSPKYMQSATVDPETNTIYWAASTEYEGALYRLNTHTGAAELVAEMPDAEEFTGLFIEADRKGLDAPAALEDVRLSYADGKSQISYTIPTKAFDGTALSGSQSVTVYIDGKAVSTESGQPGESKQVAVAVAEGSHTVILSASNDKGEGPKTIRTQWTGNDVPGEVTNLHLDLQGTTATLTWGAPVEGMHGGAVDASQVTYTVKRYPGAVVVADNITETSFTETLPDGTATYYYTVTASSPLGEGATTMSNSAFMGTAFTVPYSQDFESGEDSLSGFTIINNEEGRGWFWWYNTAQNFKAMANKFNMEDACDNWLILPSIQFKASSEYKLKFAARVFSEDDPEKFEVTIGPGATAEAQTQKLLTSTTIKNESDKIYEIPFKVASDGTWNIAFHCVSPVKAYYLIIDDIYITETASSSGPAAVTNLKATAGEGGKLEANLSFTLPTKDYSGSTLSSISKVEIYRGADSQKPVGTLIDVTPGQSCTWTDTAAEQGVNIYRVAAFAGDAKGVEATTEVFVGFDTPMPVTNAVATTEDGYNVNVSWTAPTKGVQGGDLIPSEVTYKVYANDGTVLADGLKGTSYTDTRDADATSQRMVYYQIHAQYGSYESDGVLTDFVITGPDYSVPFTESFASGGLDNTPWILSTLAGSVTGCWGLDSSVSSVSATPYDADEGFAYFKANELPSGCKARMTSPKIDLFSADHPVVSFFVYIPGGNTTETLDFQITHNDHEFTTLLNVPLTGDEGWKQFQVEIPRIHCKEGSSIAFCATSSGYGKDICVDCISVLDGGAADYDVDLEAVDIELPDEIMPGEEAELTVSVYNNGRNAVSDYKVSLYCDGVSVVTTDGTAIEAGETYNYIFKVEAEESDRNITYRYKGGVKATGDANSANDFTPERAITIGVSAVELFGADGLHISTANGVMHISGAASIPVRVYTASGLLVGSTNGESEAEIAVPSGLLIVKAGMKTFKFHIK